MDRFKVILYISLPVFLVLLSINPGSTVTSTIGAFSHLLYMFITAILFWLTAADESPESDRTWYRISIGMFVWSIAATLRLCEIYLRQPGYGTISDSFWVVGYLLLIAGVFNWFRAAGPSRIQIALTFLISGTIWVMLFILSLHPLFANPSRSILLKSLDIYYIGTDVLIVALLSAPAMRTAFGGSRLMLCAFVILLVGDLFFIRVAKNPASDILKYLDIPYTVGDFLLALAAIKQHEIVTERKST